MIQHQGFHPIWVPHILQTFFNRLCREKAPQNFFHFIIIPGRFLHQLCFTISENGLAELIVGLLADHGLWQCSGIHRPIPLSYPLRKSPHQNASQHREQKNKPAHRHTGHLLGLRCDKPFTLGTEGLRNLIHIGTPHHIGHCHLLLTRFPRRQSPGFRNVQSDNFLLFGIFYNTNSIKFILCIFVGGHVS